MIILYLSSANYYGFLTIPVLENIYKPVLVYLTAKRFCHFGVTSGRYDRDNRITSAAYLYITFFIHFKKFS